MSPVIDATHVIRGGDVVAVTGRAVPVSVGASAVASGLTAAGFFRRE
jgi:hypothetical protein